MRPPHKLEFSKVLPHVFNEQGAVRAASGLASTQTVERGILGVRAFVHWCEALATDADAATVWLS